MTQNIADDLISGYINYQSERNDTIWLSKKDK